MTDWLNALNDAWNGLARIAPVARQYRTMLISEEMPLDILAGMRASDNAPCLMLQTVIAPQALFELGGMRLTTVPDTEGTYIVLSLEDAARRDLFTTICADVTATAAHADRPNARNQFLARLDAWRQFLRDRREGLSRSDTIGLIGELIVLEQLIGHPRGLAVWDSPNDGLHDFLASGHALEVKASLGPAPTITISRLDQLDTSGLARLDLLHVRLVELADGRSLADVIDAVATSLPDDTSRRSFENALLRRGLMPDDDVARIAPRFQFRSVDAYTVTDGFPRLIRTILPAAITDATYSLDLRSLAAFSTDTANVLDSFIHGEAA
ncbi:PD-(D/E)XK motif protein [Burkholderia cepacia]|uniref:PD-(D/E)XK motif protein n=1 Tax=Burkholderia cepacia TaxID=292 RepID=UPI0026518A27|nr:PD-(D/E)XK motif protein [Burkholderia cepacia]MDN7915346.1 PD-(D/E)XK motif protein [Burkholderia cepacia]